MTVATRDYDLETIDSDDAQAARDWASRRAAAAMALQQALTRKQQINDALARDPAQSLLAALSAAQTDTGHRQADATTAQAQADAATATAARFASNDLAAAQAALDAATKSLADTLAQLLKDAQLSTALTSTVDGLALRDRYLKGTSTSPPVWDHTTIPFRARTTDAPVDPELPFPAVGEAGYTALLTVLDKLDAHVHAVADVLTTESVHQLVQGNPVRSGAVLELAATGHVPDELAVTRTPLHGGQVTHRVLVLMDPASGAAWSAPTSSVEAAADPMLNAWVSRLLPNPATVHASVQRIDPSTEVAGPALDVTLDSLRLDPLSWVRLSADSAELHQRIARVARAHWGTAASTGRLAINDASPPGSLSLSDLVTAATMVRALITGCRALASTDFATPSGAVAVVDDTAAAAVTARVATARTLLTEATTALDSAAKGSDTNALMDALFAASALGESAATPQVVDGTPEVASLRAQAAAVLPRLRARTAGTPFSADPADAAGTVNRARDCLEKFVGMRLPILIPIGLTGAGPWQKDLAGTQITLSGAQPGSVRAWLHTYARVRPAVESLLAAFDLAEALNTGATLDIRATQIAPAGVAIPSTWVGADPAPRDGTVSIVVQRSFGAALPTSVTGLAVDTWTHIVPSQMIPTGVAFHYNQPDSTPPQAVLVAVAPDVSTTRHPAAWDLGTLLDVLTSTLALARDRAVTAEQATTTGVTLADAP